MGRRRMIWAVAAAGAAAGCILPLDVAMTDGWTEVRGNGRVATTSRSLPPFDAVLTSGGVRVMVARTGRERVTLTAEDNLHPYLEAEVRGGVLHVGPRAGVTLVPRREILFRVESWEVVELGASGASLLESEIGDVPELWVTASGASAVETWGSAGTQHVTVSGASRYDGLDLATERTDVRASGASQAWVWARTRLDADASGASQVRYRGRPRVAARITGGATVAPY